MTPLHRVTAASRVFGIAAILGLGVVAQDWRAILTLLLISVVATTAVYVSLTTPLATVLVVTIEAAVTGLVIALALPAGVVFLPYLVVLSLIAGISRGVVGVSAVVVVQFATIVVVAMGWASAAEGRVNLVELLSPWVLTSIGLGLIGAWMARAAVLAPRPTDEVAYEAAHRLLFQLRALARRLPSGLDVATIGRHICELVETSSGGLHSCVFLRSSGREWSPVAVTPGADAAFISPNQPVVDDCWIGMEPVVVTAPEGSAQPYLAALPLRVGARMVGVVITSLDTRPSADVVDHLMQKLARISVRLDAASMFDELRSVATLEERRRLAREIHDGIAQEVASLGYAVDDLISQAGPNESHSSLVALRTDLSRVVNELRLSIFDLRSEVAGAAGLGAALSEYVRQVGSRSTMTVHLTLDEAPLRLRAEAEIELLRIAQEAINNARKHSEAKNLWVDCRVNPPFARLRVRDDGIGLQEGRPDSYGLRIMRERAERLQASLEVGPATNGLGDISGTCITVSLGDPSNEDSDGRGGGDGQHAHDSIARRRS